AGPACFGQANRNGLLAAGNFLPRPATAQRSFLALVHDLLNFGGCFLTVFAWHEAPPDWLVPTPQRRLVEACSITRPQEFIPAGWPQEEAMSGRHSGFFSRLLR